MITHQYTEAWVQGRYYLYNSFSDYTYTGVVSRKQSSDHAINFSTFFQLMNCFCTDIIISNVTH